MLQFKQKLDLSIAKPLSYLEETKTTPTTQANSNTTLDASPIALSLLFAHKYTCE
jgi:hypothetical protein